MFDRKINNYLAYLMAQDESKRVRRLENKLKKKARHLSQMQKHDEADLSFAQVTELHNYRVNELRVNSRIRHLAQMFEKRVPYNTVEVVEKGFKIHRFTKDGFAMKIAEIAQVTKEDVHDWFDGK